MTDVAEPNIMMDAHVDGEIAKCLTLSDPTSFFLFAGAGSGKTSSLVKALDHIAETYGVQLRQSSRKIGVITYTNAACDEIKSRAKFSALNEVSTIHSFIWSLIQGFNVDIRKWLESNLKKEIAELEDLETRGRPGTKASADRQVSIMSKGRRLESLKEIQKFIYSPTGSNRTRDSLNHAEVIKIGSEFIAQKPLMQEVLISKFPVLLIDESQDTNKNLLDALLATQQAHSKRFCLGLIGDTMQRIYSDGKEHLEEALPPGWARPAKSLNHRCPKRVVRLINRIRQDVDDQQQEARTDSPEGVVRLFIVPSSGADKITTETSIAAQMAQITGDALWGQNETVKTLILEHHMAARRLNFMDMFSPLYEDDNFKTGLLDGSLPATNFFANTVLPLVRAKRSHDEFAVARIVKGASPLLTPKILKDASHPASHLGRVRDAVDSLMSLWNNGDDPTFNAVLQNVAASRLFRIPDSLLPHVKTVADSVFEDAFDQVMSLELADPIEGEKIHPVDVQTEGSAAISAFLATSFAQIEPYSQYVSGSARFGTHQGVKGLEFPRVMVMMDDEEAGGFLFSYAKFFGEKAKSKTDIDNEISGKETTIDRTRRLFYVTCSRAKSSLALVAYSADPQKVHESVISAGWFDAAEVETLQ